MIICGFDRLHIISYSVYSVFLFLNLEGFCIFYRYAGSHTIHVIILAFLNDHYTLKKTYVHITQSLADEQLCFKMQI